MTGSGCHCSLLRPVERESPSPPPAKPHQTVGLKRTPLVITPTISQRGKATTAVMPFLE